MSPTPLLRATSHALLLGPRAIADVVAVLRGQATRVVAQQRRRAGGTGAAGPSGPGRALAHAGLSVVLWFPALVLLGASILAVVRGLLYGLVDPGPYTEAWGGPTRAGAWTAHALVGLLTLAVAGLGFYGLVALHTRMTRRLLGTGGSGWTIPAALFIGAVTLLLIISWIRQI